MNRVVFREVEGRSGSYYALLGGIAVVLLAGLGGAFYIELHGQYVTGMSNQVPWGVPHVFAIFLIVAASGALNVASVGSVFGRIIYKPMARLSGLLAFALMAGGLAILVLDLGRPDRLIVAMTHYNFKSVFVWNINFYMVFFAVIAAYLWAMMDWRLDKYAKPIGFFAFVWRLALTTCTGWVFGLIVARQAWDAAVMAPMFIIMSFAYGTAFFILVLLAAYAWSERPLGDAVVKRLKNLLAVFVCAALYFTAVQHITNAYATEHHGITSFILFEGGIYTAVFWLGQVLLGAVFPLFLLWYPAMAGSRQAIGFACLFVLLGGLSQMYVTIVGGLAYPLILFPGMEVSSSFLDGQVASYVPTLAEILLGIGGIAIAMFMVALVVKFLRVLPLSLADEVADPHHRNPAAKSEEGAEDVAQTPQAA